MAPTTRNTHGAEEAAERLLQAADLLWAAPGSPESEEEEGDEEEEAPAPQPTVEQQAPVADGDAEEAGADDESFDDASGAQPAAAPAQPPVTSTVPVLSAIQQARLNMTAQQRAALGLRQYPNLDPATGLAVGQLWQTPAERRIFRQQQRRQGAALVRFATTTGQSYPARGQGGSGPRTRRPH